MIPGVTAELQAGGFLQNSEGALVFPIPGEEVPLMVRKGDGGVGYDSTDLAALQYRLRTLRADWLVYVVDSGQALHFDLVFRGARIAGWFTPLEEGAEYEPVPPAAAAAAAAAGPPRARVQHTGFGVIQGEDGKKYKTRSGETVRLVDVLDEAKERAKAALVARLASGATGVEAGDAEALERTAAVLGYGGVKYFDLRQQRTSDYVFSYDRMLSPDGDTAVYLEYAHARLCSILRKAGEAGDDVPAVLAAAPGGTRFTHPTETALVTELSRFPGVLRRAAATLMPHVLCEFVYAVANRTAEFHRDCNVLGAATPPDVRASRLRMVAAAQRVISDTLRLLGITPLDRI